MARIGLDNFLYSLLDENEKVTVPKSFGKAIDCKVGLDLNSAELYADNALAESDYSFKKGTITITIDDDDDTVFAEILGHEISEGVMVRNESDMPPYVTVGRILTKVKNGVRKYKVEILDKVKFKDSMPDENTLGENLEFSTPSIEGEVAKLANGNWSRTKTFDSHSAALTYLTDELTGTTTPANVQAKSTTKN